MKKVLILLFLFSNLIFGEVTLHKEKIISPKFRPTSITVDENGNIYTSSHFVGSIIKYNSEFKYQYTLRIKETQSIIDIYAFKDTLYVLMLDGTLLELDYDGNLKRELIFPRGKLLGELDNPNGIFVNKDGIHIADTGNSRIVIMDFEGKKLKSFGYKTKALEGFISPNAINKLGQYYIVTDESTKEVKLLDKNGFYSGNLRNQNKETDFLVMPKDIYVDKKNDVYIADAGKNQIFIFTLDGKMKTIGEKGYTKNKFSGLKDIWVDDKYIYVADTMNKKVKILDKNSYKVIKTLGNNTLTSYILYGMIVLLIIVFVIVRRIKLKKGEIIE